MTAGRFVARAALAAAALVVALTLFLVLSTVADYAFGGDRVTPLTNIAIPGDPPVRAWMSTPPGEGPHPVVIMIHEFWGVKADTVSKAEGLAAEGYLVIAPDTFRGSSTSWVPRAIHQVLTHPSQAVNHDLDTVVDWVLARADVVRESVAVMGFCYGGRAALNYSLHRPSLAATAVFYGSPVTDPEVLRVLTGPVLGVFGGADRSISAQEVSEFERALGEAGVPNRILTFEGQPHAFVRGMEQIREGGAPAEAWGELLRFLDGSLRQPGDGEVSGTGHIDAAGAGLGYYLALAWEHTFGSGGHAH